LLHRFPVLGLKTNAVINREPAVVVPAQQYTCPFVAVRASDTSKARLEPATVKIGVDDIVNEDPPKAVALLEPPLPNAFDLVIKCLDEAVQGRLLWLAGTIEADSSTLGGQGKTPSRVAA